MKSIPVSKFCLVSNIPESFIEQLCAFQLIEIKEHNASKEILVDDIDKIQKLMRLHFELGVNLEGIDIINNLLDRITTLEERNRALTRDNIFFKYYSIIRD